MADKECKDCDGSGLVECSHCGTEEMEECPACEGSGVIEDD